MKSALQGCTTSWGCASLRLAPVRSLPCADCAALHHLVLAMHVKNKKDWGVVVGKISPYCPISTTLNMGETLVLGEVQWSKAEFFPEARPRARKQRFHATSNFLK